MLPAPLPVLIADVLRRKGTSVSDRELYNELSRILGFRVPEKDFNRALMILEIRKVVYVENIKKNLRLVHPLKLE